MTELDKEIGKILIEFEKSMTAEKIDGKKAVLLIMAINDISEVITRQITLDRLKSGIERKKP